MCLLLISEYLMMVPKKVCVIIMVIWCLGMIWWIGILYRDGWVVYDFTPALKNSEYSWFFRLLLNLMGYFSVLLPCYMLYKYLEKIEYFDKMSNSSCLFRTLYALFSNHDTLPESVEPVKVEDTKREGLELAFCFIGLMGAYLVWGLLQEKIMTQNYVMPDGTVLKFNDSQFLVFINRLLGFLIALIRLLTTEQRVIAAPLYKFCYCSLSNIISAWCQYEALKYVSFPTQVLSKSCKVIPVMMMGKLISRNKYEHYEYGTAVLISIGMMLFMLGSHNEDTTGAATSFSGFCLLALYMWCDSFTSSWQGALFRRHSLKPLQMLAAVNLCSCAFTAVSLIHHTHPYTATLLHHPMFIADASLLSLSSALGQLLIYRTIARFGPVVFTIIMTLRQAVSILVSCAVYGHTISLTGGIGIVLVFTAVFLRIYCRKQKRRPEVV